MCKPQLLVDFFVNNDFDQIEVIFIARAGIVGFGTVAVVSNGWKTYTNEVKRFAIILEEGPSIIGAHCCAGFLDQHHREPSQNSPRTIAIRKLKAGSASRGTG